MEFSKVYGEVFYLFNKNVLSICFGLDVDIRVNAMSFSWVFWFEGRYSSCRVQNVQDVESLAEGVLVYSLRVRSRVDIE